MKGKYCTFLCDKLMMTKSQAILRARRQKLGGGYGYVNVSHWK